MTGNMPGDSGFCASLARQEPAGGELREGVGPGDVVEDDGVRVVALVQRQDVRLRQCDVGEDLRRGRRRPGRRGGLRGGDADAIADSAMLSMNLTFWLTSFSIALLTGCMFCRLIDSSVISCPGPT
jgi:hypothetical protein